MSKKGETFFTTVGCMDGRVQEPIIKYSQKKFGAEYPDTITEAGLVGQLASIRRSHAKGGRSGLAKETIDGALLSSLKKKIFISLEKHHSKGIVVHGHQECAGNPVGDVEHKKDILKAAKLIQSLIPKNTPVIPVFVKRGDRKWVTEELDEELYK